MITKTTRFFLCTILLFSAINLFSHKKNPHDYDMDRRFPFQVEDAQSTAEKEKEKEKKDTHDETEEEQQKKKDALQAEAAEKLKIHYALHNQSRK